MSNASFEPHPKITILSLYSKFPTYLQPIAISKV